MLEIDGSYGEGGGQIVRTSVALSGCTGKPIRVKKIRAKRPKPGLSYQHVTAINSVCLLSNATAEGVEKGSSTIKFRPKEIEGGSFEFNIGTAGSCTLVLQCCLPLLLFAKQRTKIRIIGGTDVKWSPPVDYLKEVFLRNLALMGARIEIKLVRRGYYPKGGGEIGVVVERCEKLAPLNLKERKEVERVGGIAYISNLSEHILRRMKNSALKKLSQYETTIREERSYAYSPGVGIVLWTNTGLGANALGERGVRAEKVGENAANNLLKEISSGATVDVFATDQLLPYLALAEGKSVFLTRKLTEHARTCIWLIHKFLPVKFKVTDENGLKRVEIRGCG